MVHRGPGVWDESGCGVMRHRVRAAERCAASSGGLARSTIAEEDAAASWRRRDSGMRMRRPSATMNNTPGERRARSIVQSRCASSAGSTKSERSKSSWVIAGAGDRRVRGYHQQVRPIQRMHRPDAARGERSAWRARCTKMLMGAFQCVCESRPVSAGNHSCTADHGKAANGESGWSSSCQAVSITGWVRAAASASRLKALFSTVWMELASWLSARRRRLVARDGDAYIRIL